ncbi:MAG: TRAP transporter substrate-binding protein DctP [Rhodobacter sp.]|nr:TRAP transporter substrate-binding protein DctP [Paracoccaceae bacterium]MCB1409580.1 TRAP transporter substrate-binding protein DctP [Paracoccaceae bacterium]MCC0078412.1 TRAP transporter substrate-binding protein DctP [Rhodobacter sp.]
MRLTLKTTLATSLVALTLGAGAAQATVDLVYSDTVSENDVRSQLLQSEFGDCLGDEFNFQAYHGATLVAQGTELTAMQRGNLDMGNLAIFDFQNQVPAVGILGMPFLFRDYAHMRASYDGGVLDDLLGQVEAETGVHFLAFPYIGARQLSYIGDRRYMTPEDLAGVRLRMPGGEGWQFVGQAMGATPVPVPFTEVYTALQTHAIDAQDNGFPATHAMHFDELINHLALTNHLIAANEFTISQSKWDSMTADQQARVQMCADRFEAALDAETLRQESELQATFEAAGIDVYTPDLEAFRSHAAAMYLNSDYSAAWPEGLIDAIAAVGR